MKFEVGKDDRKVRKLEIRKKGGRRRSKEEMK